MSNANNESVNNSKVSFVLLEVSHFPLLLKWFKEPRVKKWWDKETNYSIESVHDKYISYALGYKLDNNFRKLIYPYIINIDGHLIGYIQFYDFYDFPREYDIILENLPSSLAALDLFIGEPEFINKGFGTKILDLFTKNYVFSKFSYCFVDPEKENLAAIKAYQKVGFKKIPSSIGNVEWLIKRNNS